jgi:formylmethanofuran dehydrogenase subunit E
MARVLLLIVLIWILYQIIKRIAASANTKPSAKPEEQFVLCAQCGCHVPMSESQIKNNKIICNNPECQNPTTQKNQDGD